MDKGRDTVSESATAWAWRDLSVDVWSGVFVPNKTTELLLEGALEQGIVGKSVLDLGCGSGAVGIAALKVGGAARVSGSDISQRAVDNAIANCTKLGVTADYRQGSLFEPWAGRQYEVIIDDVAALAEPIARLSPWYPPEIHCDAGPDGTANTIRMLERAVDYLTPDGHLYFPVASLSDEVKILKVARSRFPRVELLLRKPWPFREDFWQKIMANETARKLVDEGIVKVVQRGSRMLWDTAIYMACARA